MRSFVFSPIITIILNIQSIAAFCYNPDGSQVTDLSFQPCNQVSGTVSMCCGTNHTGGIDPDVCQPNGLCKNTRDNIQWRESCTDASWKSPYCLKFCTGGPRGGIETANVPVRQCSDGTYCCGEGSTTCCQNNAGLALAATIGVPSSSSASSTATSTSTSTSTPTSSTTPTTSKSSSTSDGLSTGAKAGIGVGVPLGVIAIAALLGFFFMRRRRQQRFEAVPRSDLHPVTYQEMDGKQAPVEVPVGSPVKAKQPPMSPVELAS